MAINTFYKVELARAAHQDPLIIWAHDVKLLARICIALGYKKPPLAVEQYQTKGRRRA